MQSVCSFLNLMADSLARSSKATLINAAMPLSIFWKVANKRLRNVRKGIVETARSGYRLKSWIKFKDQRGLSACGQSNVFNPATGQCNDTVENRKAKILAVIQSNPSLRIPGITNATGMSQATTKRGIETLKTEGKIEFVGPTKTGHYALSKS